MVVPMRVALANSNEQEVKDIRCVLDNSFETFAITELDSPEDIVKNSDLVVIDSNFSKNQGIDLLMNIESMTHLPILVIVPSDNQSIVVESMRAGALSFLIKTNNYTDLLTTVINEIYKQFNDNEELKRTIEMLKERVHTLESQQDIIENNSSQKINSHKSGREFILSTIAARLKKGDINLPIYSDMNNKLNLLMNEHADMKKITNLLESDASLTSKLISVANSSLYRGITKATTLVHAINRLGLTTTKNYVEVITNRSLYISKDKRFMKILSVLFKHSLACAYAANEIAIKLKMEKPDEIFTLGMLHDVGKLFLIQILSELGSVEPSINELNDDDVEKFLTDYHCQFGRVLLTRWKLPDEITAVIEHHEITTEPETNIKEICIINCANVTCAKSRLW